MNSDLVVAVHALVLLHHRKELLSSQVIAQNACTNPARVRRVMLTLKNAGLVEAHRGQAGGGYSLQNGEELTLGQVAKAFGGGLVSIKWHSGDPKSPCGVCSGMGEYMDGIFSHLNNLCLCYLDGITVAQPKGPFL